MDRDNTLDTLNELIETAKDGEYGFRTSAEHLRRADDKKLFMQRAEECRAAAAELQSLVTRLGGTAETSGSASGAMHRGWVAVKSTLSGYSERAIFEETERGEDIALSAYRSALDEPLPDDVRSVVERQYEGVRRNYNEVCRLRDRARTAGV